MKLIRPEEIKSEKFLGLAPQFTPQWNSAVSKTYKNCRPFFYTDENGNFLFPFFEIKSRIFSNKIVSLPFVDFGGVEGKIDSKKFSEIIEELDEELGGFNSILIKISESQANFDTMKKVLEAEGYKNIQTRAEAILRLSGFDHIGILFDSFKRVTRKAIRKAEKSGLTVKVNESGGIGDFYRLYLDNMKSFGAPQHSKSFFENLKKNMKENFICENCYYADKIVASLIFFINGKYSYAAFSVSNPKYRVMQPNELLHWNAIKSCFEKGVEIFDFGQCEENAPKGSHAEGIFAFKTKWPVKLYKKYVYEKNSSGEASRGNEKLKKYSSIWKRLPKFMIKNIGPKLLSQLG